MLTSAKMCNNIFRIFSLLCCLGFKPGRCCSYYCDVSKERACFDNILIWGTADHLCNGFLGCVAVNKPCPGGGSTIDNGGPRSPPRQEEHDLCNTEIDSIVHTNDGSTYVFKADKYWKLAEKGIAQGYPRKIGKDWTGLPDNIDAAVSWKTNRKLFTFFFKGDRYWKFTDQTPSRGYPKNILEWGGLPRNLDGALELMGYGDLYFFKGSQYWKYNKKERSVYYGYPKQIASNWKNVPDYIDAAFQSKYGKVVFFKAGKSFQFQDPSPKNAGQMWFGCPKY